jgi:SAM-dependent methyltransferase
MNFRSVRDSQDAAAYVARLDRDWPEREEVKSHLSAQLVLPQTAHVVEFCCGAGALAFRLLADYPTMRYTGLDFSPPLLAAAIEAGAAEDHRVRWVETDLTADDWLDHLPADVHAFVSLQSLHDLGDEAAVARILRLAARHLAPGGQMVYADLLPASDGSSGPGRLSVARHLAILTEAGFHDATCTLVAGPFGCFRGHTSA